MALTGVSLVDPLPRWDKPMQKPGTKPIGPPSAPPTAAMLDRAVATLAARIGDPVVEATMRGAFENYLSHVDVAPEDVADAAADLFLKFDIREPDDMRAALANLCH